MRSLADSHSVFESACDFDEVFMFVVLVVCEKSLNVNNTSALPS